MAKKDISKMLGISFQDRNWLLLVRLAKMGWSPAEAEVIARALEAGVEFKFYEKKGIIRSKKNEQT